MASPFQPTTSLLHRRREASPRRAKAPSVTRGRVIDKSSPSPPPPPPPKNSASAFRRFCQLPPELRLKIWNLSLPGPRLVSIRCGGASPSLSRSAAVLPSTPATNGCTSAAPIPTSLHVCAESRREALKTYPPCFGFARGPGQVLFSPGADDVMYFGPRPGFMAADSQFHTCMALCDPAELARVRRLAISDALFWIDGTYRSMTTASLTVEVLKQVAMRMPGLRELVFVPREEEEGGGDDHDHGHDDMQMVRLRLTRQIQTAVQNVCQQFPSWRPPPWSIVSLSMLPSPAG